MTTAAERGLWAMKGMDPSRFEHGDRSRYSLGCRCTECRKANAAYAQQRLIAREAGEWNGYVSAYRARQHLLKLQRQGVGRDAVVAASDVALSTVCGVRRGTQRHIRADTERRLLAVGQDCRCDSALIDAAPTWRLIDALVAEGYTKARLAGLLGYTGRGICLDRERITVRNAERVRILHARLTGEALLPVPAHVAQPRPNRALGRATA